LVRTTTRDGKDWVVCKIDRQAAKGEYNLRADVPQGKYVATIYLDGFRTLPPGLRRNGTGLTSNSGYLILKSLSDTLGTYKLTLHANAFTQISKSDASYHVRLNHKDFREIQATLQRIGNERFTEQQGAVAAHLKALFPKEFKKATGDLLRYKPGTLAGILSKKGVIKGLSQKDIDRLHKLLPDFLRKHGASGTGSERLLALSKSKRAVEFLYLDKIVQQFEKNLKKRLSENTWQRFLSDYILIFNSNYARALEKESVSLHGSHPDFILIDAYNYLDIYEIKLPGTQLLRFDKSHKNYYWSPDIAMAISQTENYLAQAESSSSLLKQDLRLRKQVDVRILRPRGFIIAGTRRQLKDEAMQNNFRLLNGALSNVEILLYDDLLASLKAFMERIRGASVDGPAKK
jgi:hypothetical protein